MRVLLGAFNARYTHSNLALRTLRQPLREAGHQVRLREFSINQDLFEVLAILVQENPEILLLSVYIWNAQSVRRILPEIPKILPHCRVILGGPEAGFSTARWLGDFPAIQGIISGPGESAVALLAKKNFANFPASKILTLKNPPFSQLPFPYLPEDFPGLAGHYLYYESSRGCPFSCSYCLSSRTDQDLEFRTPEQVAQEIDLLLQWNPHSWFTIKFVDRTFNVKPPRAREIWRHLAELETTALFHFEIHPQLLTSQDFELLATVPEGRFQFEIGIQSVNAATLKAVNRAMDWDKSKKAIAQLLEIKNIHIHLDLIAGLPGETLEDFSRSFDEVFGLGAPHIQVGFLKVLPGTVLADRIFDLGIQHLETPPYEVLSTGAMTFTDLDLVRDIEALVDSVWNSGNLNEEIHKGLMKHSSAWKFFLALRAFTRETNWDLHTKGPGRVKAMLVEFLLKP